MARTTTTKSATPVARVDSRTGLVRIVATPVNPHAANVIRQGDVIDTDDMPCALGDALLTYVNRPSATTAARVVDEAASLSRSAWRYDERGNYTLALAVVFANDSDATLIIG